MGPETKTLPKSCPRRHRCHCVVGSLVLGTDLLLIVRYSSCELLGRGFPIRLLLQSCYAHLWCTALSACLGSVQKVGPVQLLTSGPGWSAVIPNPKVTTLAF